MLIRPLLAGLALASSTVAASAAVQLYSGILGPEVPTATGSGSLALQYDPAARTLAIDTSFAGLSGNTTVAHIHCCVDAPGTAGVAVTPGTLPGFPTGVQAGSYAVVIDLSLATSFTSSFLAGAGGGSVAGAEAALVAGLDSGRAYFNVHTSAFPGGEIRTFTSPVPEPSSYALMAVGLGVLAWAQRRRRRHVRH